MADLNWLDNFTYCEVFLVSVHRYAKASERGDGTLPGCGERNRSVGGYRRGVRWHNFDEVRGMFKDADNVDGYVIFDIRRNRYRLITVIHYAKTTKEMQTKGHVYIRSFLTHKEYNNRSNWDRRFGTK
jgi:mRNA interferase HigB